MKVYEVGKNSTIVAFPLLFNYFVLLFVLLVKVRDTMNHNLPYFLIPKVLFLLLQLTVLHITI